jgi:hypothetical protein
MKGRINADSFSRHSAVPAKGHETHQGAHEPRSALRFWRPCCWSIVATYPLETTMAGEFQEATRLSDSTEAEPPKAPRILRPVARSG